VAGGGKGNCTQAGSAERFKFAGTLEFSVGGFYKNFTRMSPNEFELSINLTGEKISKKYTAFRKAISVQERLALTLRFLASGDSYVSLQYLF